MKYARFNVSIPPDVKARMEQVDESVNWSAVAVQAFEQKLAEIVKRQGPKNMGEALERLRVSKRKHGVTDFWKGHSAGEKWAMQTAEAQELVRLADWKDQFYGGDWGGEWEDTDNGPLHAVTFACTVDPNNTTKRSEAEQWWDELGYPKLPPAEFVHGFADGALDVWAKV